jgi:sarcosine oxidase subunit gamma
MIYDVTLETLDLFCVFDLKGSRSGITSLVAPLGIVPPEKPNTGTRSGDMALCWVGPTQWILRAPEAAELQLLQQLQVEDGDENTSAVEVSDMFQFFSVCGRDADDVLAVSCPLDTHVTAFPANAVTFTELFGTKALLLRVTDGYHFAVDRSYADFVNDLLHRILGTPLPVNHAGRPPYDLSG